MKSAISERPIAVGFKKAGSLTGVSWWKIRDLVRSGHLPVVRLGRRRVVPYDALEKLIRDWVSQ